MSRRRASKSGTGVQLFPFLAVLICTMGALVMLLFVFARHGQMQAREHARSGGQPARDTRLEQEEIQWRIEQLRIARDKTQQDLERARLQLSHVEDHLRRLRDQARQFRAAVVEIDRAGSSSQQERDEAAKELAALHAQKAQAEKSLAAAESAANRPVSYSVVPYDGPNHTRRRPIYIECRADAVVLRPEGIYLSDADFEGPLGAGNPLAAALRAQREYLAGHAPRGAGEPYPLLLVRPDGIAAYYAARAALTSWGADFGYELIGEDWNLAFPQADPELGRLTEQVVSEARVRQRALAQAAPNRYMKRGTRYRASPTRGGFVAEGGSPGRGTKSRFGGFDWSGKTFNDGSAERTDTASAKPGSPGGDPPSAEGSGGKNGATAATAAKPRAAQVASLAKTRGRDWGLPDGGHGSVAVTRPIHLECLADRVIVLPDDGTRGGKQLMLGLHTEASIDQLVSAIWEQMKGWGIAGKGMYWRPTLVVTVGPGGMDRYLELRTLLDDSGLEVRAKIPTPVSALEPSNPFR